MTEQNDSDQHAVSPVPSVRADERLSVSVEDSSVSSGGSSSLISTHARGGELFKIWIVNLVLSIVTLGIYRFWGKTRMRRYLWGHVEVMGDRLEYTGTGQELFKGFLIVFFIILLPVFGGFAALDYALVDADPGLQGLKDIAQLIVILFLIPVALFRARRYRLTRTHWRGIYGGQTGSSLTYGFLSLGCYVLTILTLGLIWPVCSVWLTRYEMKHTWIGDQQPEFTPRIATLYKSYLVVWVLVMIGYGLLAYSVITLTGPGGPLQVDAEGKPVGDPSAFVGLMFAMYGSLLMLGFLWQWYQGRVIKHFVSVTSFHNHELATTISGLNFVWLLFSNWLLRILTLGLATPWTFTRALNYIEAKVDVVGDGDFSALLQSTQDKPSTGEGLADAFDVGGF